MDYELLYNTCEHSRMHTHKILAIFFFSNYSYAMCYTKRICIYRYLPDTIYSVHIAQTRQQKANLFHLVSLNLEINESIAII